MKATQIFSHFCLVLLPVNHIMFQEKFFRKYFVLFTFKRLKMDKNSYSEMWLKTFVGHIFVIKSKILKFALQWHFQRGMYDNLMVTKCSSHILGKKKAIFIANTKYLNTYTKPYLANTKYHLIKLTGNTGWHFIVQKRQTSL